MNYLRSIENSFARSQNTFIAYLLLTHDSRSSCDLSVPKTEVSGSPVIFALFDTVYRFRSERTIERHELNQHIVSDNLMDLLRPEHPY